MGTAMTTFARGLPALRPADSAVAAAEAERVARRDAVPGGWATGRLAIHASTAERRALQRDHAWLEAAAIAGLRMPRG